MNLSSEKDASLRPRAVLPGVSTGCPAAGGWLHTRYAPVRHSRRPEGRLTVRLACIRPAASVHPEPGSNSSLYYCFDFFFLCSIGPALVLVYAFCLYLHGTASLRPPMDLSCWLLKLSKNPRLRSAPSCLSPLSSAGAKVELFPIRNSLPQSFFRLFCTFSASSPQHAVRQTPANSCGKTFFRNFSHKK